MFWRIAPLGPLIIRSKSPWTGAALAALAPWPLGNGRPAICYRDIRKRETLAIELPAEPRGFGTGLHSPMPVP